MNAWPKICGVCQKAIYAGEWTSLSFVGYDVSPDERLELRNHACGNTLVVRVEVTGLPHTIADDLAVLFRIEGEQAEGLPSPNARRQVRRKVTEEEMMEAFRLYEIADELEARVERAIHPSSAPPKGRAA